MYIFIIYDWFCIILKERKICFNFSIEIVSSENKQNIDEDNSNKDGDHCQESSTNSPCYEDMVNRMLESTRGRKRKANSSSRKPKRFKKGRAKK